ncbi:MAG: extracellular solute-binding protein family 1 [Solirubrobacterales bacterium]|nr:extracellular solute-binding protein family 1 [Solirubrobacterales bacterium]
MRSMFSRSAPMALVCALGLSALAGCGSSSSANDASAKPDPNKKVTLRLVGTADVKAPAEKVIADYKAKYPNVTIQSSFTQTDQYVTATRAQLGGSNGADLIAVFPGAGNAMSMGPLAKAGVLADLSDASWAAQIPARAKPLVSSAGKSYFFPLASGVIGVAYDKAVFAKAGVAVPTTFQELLSACSAFRAKGVEPMAIGMKTDFVPQFISYAMVPSLVYAKDPGFDQQQAAGSATFAKSGWREAFTRYVQLQKGGCFNKGFTGTSFDDAQKMVAQGKAAMEVTVSEAFPAIQQAAKDPSQIAMFPFPAADSAAANWVPSNVSVGFGVNARSKNQADAKQFLDFINSPAEAAKWANSLGDLPLGDNPTAPPGITEMVPPIKAGHVAGYPDQSWPNAEVQTVHNAVVQELFTGQTSIDGALTKMDDAYKQGG